MRSVCRHAPADSVSLSCLSVRDSCEAAGGGGALTKWILLDPLSVMLKRESLLIGGPAVKAAH